MRVGYFDKTLPLFKKDESRKIAFLHLDADLYSSTKIVLDSLKDQITKGTIIVFDEYFNYPGWEQGEFKAFQEFIKETNYQYQYIGYTNLQQCAVEITSVNN